MTAAVAAAKLRNFAESFAERFDIARELSLKRMRAIEGLNSLVTQRLECEADYSRRMRALSATNYAFYEGYLWFSTSVAL